MPLQHLDGSFRGAIRQVGYDPHRPITQFHVRGIEIHH
jgi:hypothetical protein